MRLDTEARAKLEQFSLMRHESQGGAACLEQGHGTP